MLGEVAVHCGGNQVQRAPVQRYPLYYRTEWTTGLMGERAGAHWMSFLCGSCTAVFTAVHMDGERACVSSIPYPTLPNLQLVVAV